MAHRLRNMHNTSLWVAGSRIGQRGYVTVEKIDTITQHQIDAGLLKEYPIPKKSKNADIPTD